MLHTYISDYANVISPEDFAINSAPHIISCYKIFKMFIIIQLEECCKQFSSVIIKVSIIICTCSPTAKLFKLPVFFSLQTLQELYWRTGLHKPVCSTVFITHKFSSFLWNAGFHKIFLAVETSGGKIRDIPTVIFFSFWHV